MTTAGERGNQGSVILVVDDEPLVLRIIKGVLSMEGFRVLAAASAGEAMEVHEREPRIDLLLSDVVMPGVSGPELADVLLARDPGLRVLLTAGMPDTPVIRAAILDRGFAFIPKPFLPSELSAKVRQVLAKPCLAAAGARA
jgi:two-component system, cell cycle sensor histidine kinase and response regulator CckA